MSYALQSTLQNMYAKHKSVQLIRQVFDKTSRRNLVEWSEIIERHMKQGHYEDIVAVYCEMQGEGVHGDNFIYPKVVKACAQLRALRGGAQIHASAIKTGYHSNIYVGNSLIDMYLKCGNRDNARQVFDKMAQKDVISWNILIAGYAQRGYIDDATEAFRQMLQHHQGIEPDVVTWNTMLTTLSQRGQCEEALKVFRQMQEVDIEPNCISWTAVIAGHTQNGHHDKALQLFYEMQQLRVRPDPLTISTVLSACGHALALDRGKEIHGYIVRSSFDLHSFIGSALVAMYTSCGSIKDACHVFDKIPQRDRQVVLWNAMIAGHSQNGKTNCALRLFRQMQMGCVKPNKVTMASILPACAGLATLQLGKEIHAYIIRSGIVCDLLLQNALIDVYGKCGSLKYARVLFDNMFERDVVSWTIMIGGYGMHGLGEDAVFLFCQMQEAGMKPNLTTFTCILSACSHAGLLDEGLEYFRCMTEDHHMEPSMEQYACLVDLLGRAGRLDEAQNLIESMPFEANACLWGSMLNACRIHSNIPVGEYAAKKLYKLEPENAGNYVQMSNIYAAFGRWEDVAKVRKMMEEAGLRKPPGCSWIEVKNKVHAFVQGEGSYPPMGEIYPMLD